MEDFNNKRTVDENKLIEIIDTEKIGISSDQKVFKIPEEPENLTEVINKMATDEVRRMSNNLFFIDILESELKTQIQERINTQTLDLETLQKVMDTMNKSVSRSNKIIQDKDSNLVQILIDARTNVITNETKTNSDNLDDLNPRSRKKLTRILNALLDRSLEVSDESDEDPE